MRWKGLNELKNDIVIVRFFSSDYCCAIRGKDKPTFTPHTDGGDYVVVINAEKIKVTGSKFTNKKYYKHSLYPGGLKTQTFQE